MNKNPLLISTSKLIPHNSYSFRNLRFEPCDKMNTDDEYETNQRNCPPIVSDSESKVWYQIVDHVKRAVESKFSLINHHFNAESRFVFSILDRVVHEEPVLIQETERFIHKLYIGKVHIEKPLSQDSSSAISLPRPTYPYESRWRDQNYTANTKVDLVYKLKSKLDTTVLGNDDESMLDILFGSSSHHIFDSSGGDGSKFKRQNTLEDATGFVANIGEFFVQVRGQMCRLKGSGILGHENPDDEGGYHIVGGQEKYTEGQFFQRGNHAYVHFQNSSTSQSQSATAAEATNTESSSTVDSPIVLACDYRPTNDEIHRYNSAFHVMLMVHNPRHARKAIQKRMRSSLYDAESFSEESSPTIPLIQDGSNLFSGPNTMQGLGEQIALSFPNVKDLNFNLSCILFLLGLNDRNEMIRCIIPEECKWLEDAKILNRQTGKVSWSARATELSKEKPQLRHAYLIYNQVYGIFHNQSLFATIHNVDPNKIYYHIPSAASIERQYDTMDDLEQDLDAIDIGDSFEKTPGTYEYIVKNHAPFIGHDDSSQPCSNYERDTSGRAWHRPDDFLQKYDESTFDGWDRCATLAHICHLILHPTYKELPQKRRLPDGKDEAKDRAKAFSDFSSSFIEEFLPHLGTSAHWRVIVAKRILLGSIVRKMVLVYMGYIPPDAQDHLSMKRVDAPGHLMSKVWRNAWNKGIRKLFRQAVNQVESMNGDYKHVNWPAIAASSFTASPFNSAMVKGVWPKGGKTVMDVSGSTKRLVYPNEVTLLECMRKTHTVMNKKGATRLKDSAAQQLNDSHYGMFCSLRTHNDNQAGIDVYMAKGSHLRIGYDPSELICAIMMGHNAYKSSPFYNAFVRLHDMPCTIEESAIHIPCGSTLVLANGAPVGYTLNPPTMMRGLKHARLKKIFPFDVSVTWVGGPLFEGGPLQYPFYNYIHVSGDWGAMLRPVIDLKNFYKMPLIVATHTSAYGIFPNFTLKELVAKYLSSMAYMHDDTQCPPVGDFNLRKGQLFDTLLKEGVIVYRDSEELSQEVICPSMTALIPQIDYWMVNRNDNPAPLGEWNLERAIRDTLRLNPGGRHSRSTKAPWTCVEISEEFAMGVTATTAPFVNCDDACRASYSTGYTMQSTGAAPLNQKWRRNIYNMSLLEPKKSLSPNSASELYSIIGAGSASIPTLIALMSRDANGEDGIERSRSGWGKFDVRHTHIQQMKAKEINGRSTAIPNSGAPSQSTDSYTFAKPNGVSCVTLKTTDYSALDENTGLPRIGAKIPTKAAVIGSIFPIKQGSTSRTLAKFRDGSRTNCSRMTLRVGSITRTKSSSNTLTHATIRTSALRVTENGDKFSSRHGQKGVATMTPRWDLPYMRDPWGRGLHPDVYRGPHGIPSRTTMGEYRESTHSAICIQEGRIKTVHPFERDFFLFDQLSKVKPKFGTSVMINPDTGIPYISPISVGVIDYGTLHHLGRDTLNSRSLGAVDPRTGQPTQGTKKIGGVKEGPLEVFNKVSQGSTEVTEQLLFTGSDPDHAHICCKCGLQASPAIPQFLRNIDNSQISPDLPQHERMELIQKAKIFDARLGRVQYGDVKISNPSAMEQFGKTVKPSGGYCPVCKTSETVYLVPMPRIYKQLAQNVYMSGLAWRLVLDIPENKYEDIPLQKSAPRQMNHTFDPSSGLFTAKKVLNIDLRSGPILDREQQTMGYEPTSPAYSPSSPAYNPEIPSYHRESHIPNGTIPAFSPPSPAYSPTSPAYDPYANSTSPDFFSPRSPEYYPGI